MPIDGMTESESVSTLTAEQVFPGDGEMATLMRSLEWAATPLGPVETWAPSLRMMTRFLLPNRFPMLLWWGPDFLQLYNDAYRPVLGTKHPRYLGRSVRECWSEIWDVIGPLIETPFNGGPATWMEDIPLEVNRHGFVEETHFTIAYSPVPDETAPNGIGGVLATVHEISEKVVGERRVLALRDLGARSAEAKTTEEACQIAAETLASHPKDLPFALLYLIDPDGLHARLAATAGVEQGSALSPSMIALDGGMGAGESEASSESRVGVRGQVWPLAEVVRTETVQVVEDLASRFGAVPPGPWSDPPHMAAVVPIHSNIAHQLSGILVAGVSARLRFDDRYAGFFELVSGQLATAIANARAYEEERRRAEALAEIDRAKTAFFSNVSHEFRTPLTLTLAPLEELLQQPRALSKATREQLQMAHRNGLRLLKLVNTLLDFSRIEAGRVQASYEPTDLAALTTDLASAFRSVVERAGLRLVVDCPPLPEPAYVDRDMWEKIVLNLLSNAFKFTMDGEIAVTLRRAGQSVALSVRDTGTGIPPEELPRLFERFHRVQGTVSRTYEGSGIGLALVQELVKLHGGEITVASRPGEGTTFTVSVPLGAAHLPTDQIAAGKTRAGTAAGAAPFVEEARRWLAGEPDTDDAGVDNPPSWAGIAERVTASHEPPYTGKAGTARLLVVDDNADMRDYLRHLLDARYRVETVANGVEALAAAQQNRPDLILTDIMMPELDGFGLLRELRADAATREIPIILLSARAGEEATIEGLEQGADDYLVKPFSANEVLARVASHLEMARLRREAVARAQELEATFAAMTDAVFVYDREGVIVRTNSAARTLFGLDARPDYETSLPQERAAIIQVRDEQGRPISAEESGLYRLLRGETLTGANALDVRLRLTGGRELEVSISGAPLRDETGKIIGAVAVSRDVTERRRLERERAEALKALLELAAAIVSVPTPEAGVPDGSLEPRGDEELRSLATLCCRVLGSDRVAIIAVEPETGLLRPVAVSGGSPKQEQRFRAGFGRLRLADRFGAESIARLRAGEMVLISVEDMRADDPTHALSRRRFLMAPMLSAGTLTGYIGVNFGDEASDYTPQNSALALAVAQLVGMVMERERLSHEREAARAEALALQEATRRMDEFLGIASHELRTPLTSITANAQLASKQLRGLEQTVANTDSPSDAAGQLERVESLLQRTSRQLGRLDRLIGDLLDVSRIQAGKLDMRPQVCDLAEIVREAVQEQRAAWPEREISLDLTRRSPLPIHADADRIGQVMTNILTNALKYSAESEPVAVRVRVLGETVRAEVRDRGPGLTAAQREHLFERFYRVPGIEQQSGSGMGLGLGLYICRTIVERHGGRLGVESARGKGSTFWFELPLSPANEAPSSMSPDGE